MNDIIDYKNLKKQNMIQLVNEYETERNAVEKKLRAQRKADIDLLHAHAQVLSLDYQFDQDEELFQINKAMIKHFDNVKKQMIANYEIFDLAARAYADVYKNIQCTKQKSRPSEMTAHDLKMYVCSFNSQHRK